MNESLFQNFLTNEQEDAIESLVTDARFPWFFSTGTVLPKDVVNNPCVVIDGLNPPQFIHPINLNTFPHVNIIKPILDFLAIEFQTNISIIRMKFNLLMKRESDQYHLPHTDIDDIDNCFTAIYYVTESDGHTYLFNEFSPKSSEEVTIKSQILPEKGKLAIFHADRFHSSSSPVNSEYRIVLNVVFKPNIQSEQD